uniref:Uncharacterized protein n=1 Tax=Papio anubis TaxID=9555 RepID=A0A8I5P0U3_PAPAN
MLLNKDIPKTGQFTEERGLIGLTVPHGWGCLTIMAYGKEEQVTSYMDGNRQKLTRKTQALSLLKILVGEESRSVTQAGVQWHNLSSLQPLLGSSDSCASASQAVGITGVLHRAKFRILVQMGFHHVGQAGLEMLTSIVPPASASQSAGITDVSHCAQLHLDNFFFFLER